MIDSPQPLHAHDPGERSRRLFDAARLVIPGGVNSPVRAFGAVGGTPLFIASGSGAIVTDVDDREYIDYVGSWGPLILGHAHPRVVAAIQAAAERGSSFGAPTEGEVRLAEMIVERVSSIEMVRLVSSGTEAVMSAIRVARAFTNRAAVIKFEGCYHGHSDALLVRAGSGAMTLGMPSSPGVPPGATADTLVVPYNDIAAVREAFRRHRDGIAAVIVEPVAGNMGVVLPVEGFLQGLADVCRENGALLIFDEIITGFRVARGGAQAVFGITPDLTCLGKIIGGGVPLAAYGGRREVMSLVSPEGPVYQAGTLSGNPAAVAAGIATLEALDSPGIYEALDESAAALMAGFREAAAAAGVSTHSARVASMSCSFFVDEPVTDYAGALRADTRRYARFFHAMLRRGVYLAPSQFECMFVSTAHTREHIGRTVEAAREAFVEAATG